jgi:ATP-binding cassette subfamily F protein 3
MSFIQIENLGFHYETQSEDIFSDVNFTIADGEKIALIGPNGSGKTTLLKLILKELTPNFGEVIYPKSNPKIGYLRQDFTRNSNLSILKDVYSLFPNYNKLKKQRQNLEKIMQNTASEQILEKYGKICDVISDIEKFHTEAQKMLTKFGFGKERLSQIYDTLSGGEKTRLELAKLLLSKPDLLILDEPTNHLDLEILEWLEDFLLSYQRAVFFVTHDRYFIDKVADKIIDLRRGFATIYRTNYSEYLKLRTEKEQFELKKYQERQKKIKQLKEVAQKRRQWAQTFQKETRAEGGGWKFEMITNPAKKMMKKAKAVEKRIEQLQEDKTVKKPWQEKKRKVRFSTEYTPSSKYVFTAKNLSHSFDELQVFKDFSLTIPQGDRLAVLGKNGSGKTTLLKIIAGVLQPNSGEIYQGSRVKCGYYAQEHEQLNFQNQIIEELRSVNSEESEVRNILGCVKIEKEQVYQKISTLSVGERSKVALAKILADNCNLLVLDEPTNHLDIDTRESLENALSQFNGTLVFVSHDRYFINKLATNIINLDDLK